MERLGTYRGVDIFLCALDRLDAPIAFPKAPFRLIPCLDAQEIVAAPELLAFIRQCLQAGPTRVGCYGSGAELVGLLFDYELAERDDEAPVLTTEHRLERHEDVLYALAEQSLDDPCGEEPPAREPVFIALTKESAHAEDFRLLCTDLEKIFARLVSEDEAHA